MRRLAAALVLAGVGLAMPAQAAEPKLDPASEAWFREFGDRYEQWHSALAFDVDLYFGDGKHDDDDNRPTPNLIDARYSIALRRFQGWAFAVDMQCAGDPATCRPVLRMVSAKPRDAALPAWLKTFRPKSREDTARVVAATFDWREADLRACPAALTQLTGFPKAVLSLWPDGYLRWLAGEPVKQSNDIVVTTDGDAVSLRARGQDDPGSGELHMSATGYVAEQANGGDAYDWAIAMHDAVEPCLKPSNATPPWQKALALPDTFQERE